MYLAGIQTILKRHFSRLFMQKWEYIVDRCLDDFNCVSEVVLDHLGDLGWELVCTDVNGNFIFRRQKQFTKTD